MEMKPSFLEEIFQSRRVCNEGRGKLLSSDILGFTPEWKPLSDYGAGSVAGVTQPRNFGFPDTNTTIAAALVGM